MLGIPWLVTIFLVLIGVISGWYIPNSTDLDLSHADIVQAEIGIFACIGAFISATWLIAGFFQTNRAFIESKRPQLLIHVRSQKLREDNNSDKMIPVTAIHYQNITSNRFNNLNINVSIEVGNQCANLNPLFSPDMVMVGGDTRVRQAINILKEAKNKGIDLNAVASVGVTKLFLILVTAILT